MAKRKIVISEHDNIAALMEEERAVEFIIHRGDMLLGDVYLATVENILPSIDAAFVNVGGDKMGFLHSSDVPGKGDLKERLEPKQQLVVQIMKEPTGHKGPRVSTNISLPGRFLVMMPESKGISISRKIMETAERSRLKSIVSLIKPAGVGVIIRTEAENQKESDITEDFETLLERWQNIVSMADTASPPTLLYRDQDLLYRVIREAVTEDVTEIIVDSAFGSQRAQQLLQNWNMDKGVKVTHYQGSQPILVGTGVDKEIKLALNTKVPLPSGGYLYIQPTEALTVVDVNSGKFTSLQSQAETIKLTNLEACKEIARQLRLRNIGGMIVVDFIDMESRANQLQVMQTFENELAPDKAKPQIGQLSDLGLVEMTRHRQGQSLSEIFTRRCHSCGGTGHALDELAWMHPGDGDGRGRKGDRHKLPTRHSRGQQVPRPAASLSKRERTRVTINALAGGGKGAGEKPNESGVTPGNILLNSISEKRQQGQTVETQVNLAEHYSEQTYKAFGIKLASVTKLAYLPSGINQILSRINPKANDIVSLVHSIEETANMPVSIAVIDDLDDDELAHDDDENPVAEEAPGNGRHQHHRRGHSRMQSRDEEEEPDATAIDVSDASEEDADEDVRPTPRRGRPPSGRANAASRAKSTVVADESSEDEPSDAVEHTDEETVTPMAPRTAASRRNAATTSKAETVADEETEAVKEESPTNERVAVAALAHEVDDAAEPDDDDAAEDDDDDEAGSATASKPGSVRPRRGGRPAKRSIKKPPAKR